MPSPPATPNGRSKTLSPKVSQQTPPSSSPPSASALSPDRFTQGEIITLYVGQKRKKFHIYKDLLVEKSPYFAASLRTCWNQSNEIHLGGEADAFGHFVNWMFRGTIPQVDLSSCAGLAEVTAFYQTADFLMIESLKNEIIDGVLKFLEIHIWALNFYSVSYLRDRYLEKTMLYRLVFRSAIRQFATKPGSFGDEEENDMGFVQRKPELMMEILNGVREYNVKPYDQVWKCARCTFHEHKDSTICL